MGLYIIFLFGGSTVTPMEPVCKVDADHEPIRSHAVRQASASQELCFAPSLRIHRSDTLVALAHGNDFL